MKKRVIRAILIVFAMAIGVCGFVACNDKDKSVATVESIYMWKYPTQYYEVDTTNGSFSLVGGEIGVIYSDGTVKQVSLLSDEVTVSNVGGTSRADTAYTVLVEYKGLKTSFRYYVCKVGELIKNVELEDADNTFSVLYAKSSLRTFPDFNELKLKINYADTTKASTIIKLSNSPFVSYGITMDGFDVTTVGSKQLTLNFKASSFILPYEVVDDDWVIDATIVDENTMKTNYLVGESFYGGDAKVRYTYNSEKYETVPLTADLLTGFDTSAATTNGAFAIDCRTTAFTFTKNYKVFSADEVSGFADLKLGSAVSMINVNDEMTFEEYLTATKLELITATNEKIAITAATDGIAVTRSDNGATVDEAAYNSLKTKGQQIDLTFTFKASDALSCEAPLTILKTWVKTIIQGWNTVVTDYTVGSTFSFGTATLKKVYDDGTESEEISLQTEYEKTSGRSININDLQALQTYGFDMTEGAHNYKYYVSVSRTEGLIIDGVTQSGDSGRVYISYTVTAE